MAVSIRRGTAHALFAFEVGQSMDLAACERLIPALGRQTLHHPRRAPQSFQYRPAPLRMSQDAEQVELASVRSHPRVDLVLYDFGSMLVSFGFPLSGPLERLVELSCALQNNQDLLRLARQRALGMLEAIRSAVQRPHVPEIAEDYVIFHLEELEGGPGSSRLLEEERPLLAQILRADQEVLSAQEINDTLAANLSFSQRDVTIVDWNAALVVDPDADETRAVLEFGNVQLLEMRYLDRELDDALEQAYQRLAASGLRRRWLPRGFEADLEHLSALQVDAAVLFERVTNALKLVGDMYLSRLYRLASARFHLAEWDDSITRKLQTLDGIYQKVSDRAAARRLEVLEWIVILLIALEVVLGLVR